MIPIQLTIQGLYSYQTKQTIDFTKLTASHLFGIFGSVGSGKSSILEAITFALYGETDRLNSRDGRNYNMMNLKSNELLIDFIFETGKNQTAYRAIVKGKRNSKKFDDVKALERTSYQKISGNWEPIEPSDLGLAIGLSYENFKRTIIIPQGQFQEFLQLKDTARTQMLKELFNLERFELYYKTAALESKNNEQLQNTKGQIQQLGEVDTEKAKLYEIQIVQLSNELNELELLLKNLQKDDATQQQILLLTNKLELAKKELELLKKQEPEFKQLEKTISDYEKCELQFKNILDSLKISNSKIELKKLQIRTEEEKLAKLESEITKNDTELSSIKPGYETRELLKQKAEELIKIIKIKDLKDKTNKESERLKKGDEILFQTSESINKLNIEKEKLENFIKTEKLKLPDFSMLSKVKYWFLEKQNLDKQDFETNGEIKKIQQEQNIINQSIESIFSEAAFSGFADKKEISAAIVFLQNRIDEIKTKVKVLNSEADQLRVKAQLEKFAQNLEDGNPCPLCGAVHHPEKYSAASIAGEKSKLETALQAFEDESETISKTISRFNEYDNHLKLYTRQNVDLQIKLKTITEKTASHISAFEWPGFKTVDDVENAFISGEKIQKEIKKNEAGLEEITKKLTLAQKEKERYQAEIERIRREILIAETETKTQLENLKTVSFDLYFQVSTTQIETEKTELLKKAEMFEKRVNELTNILAELRKTKDTLSGSLIANRTELTNELESNANWQKQIIDKLQNSGFSSVEEVQFILAQPVELDKLKEKLSAFKQNINLASSRFEELQNEKGTVVYDAETHQKVKAEILKYQELQNQRNQEKGKIQEIFRKLQKDLENHALLSKTIENLEFRAENIKTMKSLFKASGFVNYISSVYLQNLCNAANDRFFKITRQKLSLEITEDNNFQVRDFMNGGKVRSVKTLSGGQTFQAALSLALALADNIQKITESNQNFFFLDEGFGSLDKESLSIVFDTLKSLRHENRIVGVISHVEEMQQEIEVHLRVVNSDETGSKILESWAV